MQINRNWFLKEDYVFQGDLDFSKEQFEGAHIRQIENCHFEITGNVYDNLFILNVHIVSKVIAVSAYSLKDVPLNLDFSDVIEITDEEIDDEELFYEKNPIFDIDPYILSLIVSEVPMVVVDKDESLPKDGFGYRVLTEEEYQEEQKNKKDSRWSKLDDIELD